MLHRRAALALPWATPFALALPALAQGWSPDRPIRAIVPFAPGGTTDVVARVFAEAAAAQLGQPLVIENRPGGAAGLVGMDLVAKAPPDGHTILIHSNAIAVVPALVARMPFDVMGDLAPLAHLGRIPQVLVVDPRLPVRSMAELLAYVRARPGQLNFASAGIGSAIHLAGEVFRSVAKLDIQPVHYRGGGPAMQAVISGEVVFTIDPVASASGHIRGGSVRAICITGPDRAPSLPEVPSATEAGLPELKVEAWVMAMAPARTPAVAVARYAEAFARAAEGAKQRLADLGVQPATVSGSAALTEFLRQDMARSVGVLREAGVQPE
ncbi:Bug family tripartite tricarboxylate transporter substrate binding protein [Siccirubricoccus phaeus]|uniref:Bug family tripartite tricarboxylate transporter substrate binding protein n=1 Tax=Siccirubricoccus phaeus TaxID=2595053 RepID=UPI00165C5D14|nr:tripartite tricarboxylate transporter substrate-binding protein [Siccirubricoccus phaeus]